MRGEKTLELVLSQLEQVAFPDLQRPPGSDQPPTKVLVLWGIKVYSYSVIFHLREILRALLSLSRQQNSAAAFILARHLFEVTSHACHVLANLKIHIDHQDWSAAWTLLTASILSSSWMKRFGKQFGEIPKDIPEPLRVGKLLKSYEEYQLKLMGTSDVFDSYGFLSDQAHPNGSCFSQHHEYLSDRVTLRFSCQREDSPLPIVNWSLLDSLTFTQELLGISGEGVVLPSIRLVLAELAKRAPKRS